MTPTPQHEGDSSCPLRGIESLDRPLPPPDGAPVWKDHDRLPASGAWLYVTTQDTLDEGRHAGSWVPADMDPHRVAMAVGSAVGQPAARADLVVIDQIGLEAMADEDHLVPQRYRA